MGSHCQSFERTPEHVDRKPQAAQHDGVHHQAYDLLRQHSEAQGGAQWRAPGNASLDRIDNPWAFDPLHKLGDGTAKHNHHSQKHTSARPDGGACAVPHEHKSIDPRELISGDTHKNNSGHPSEIGGAEPKDQRKIQQHQPGNMVAPALDRDHQSTQGAHSDESPQTHHLPKVPHSPSDAGPPVLKLPPDTPAILLGHMDAPDASYTAMVNSGIMDGKSPQEQRRDRLRDYARIAQEAYYNSEDGTAESRLKAAEKSINANLNKSLFGDTEVQLHVNPSTGRMEAAAVGDTGGIVQRAESAFKESPAEDSALAVTKLASNSDKPPTKQQLDDLSRNMERNLHAMARTQTLDTKSPEDMKNSMVANVKAFAEEFNHTAGSNVTMTVGDPPDKNHALPDIPVTIKDSSGKVILEGQVLPIPQLTADGKTVDFSKAPTYLVHLEQPKPAPSTVDILKASIANMPWAPMT